MYMHPASLAPQKCPKSLHRRSLALMPPMHPMGLGQTHL
jgi:hypothetical protein